MQGGKIEPDTEKSELERYTFLLRRGSANASSPSLSVDFSPQSSKDTSPASTANFPSFPVFSSDSSYYTPSFVLAIDKSKYAANASAYLSLHEAKRQELTLQKTELLVPRPSKVNSYCCICKAIFDDYLTHVSIPKHQELMHASQFTESIAQLCTRFNPQPVETRPMRTRRKSKKIQKSEKPKRKCGNKLNLMSMSTSANLDDSLESRRKEITA